MCTLILAWQVFDGTPIVVGANRDERLDRPSVPPAVVGTDPTVVAPRDERAGGTWIGYNENGVFAAITNRRAPVSGERSRGLLVHDALELRSASEAARQLERELDRQSYEGFNLVVADATTAMLFEWDGSLSVTPFEPGVHVVVNTGADGADEKATRLRDALWPEPHEGPSEWLDRTAAALRDHELGTCVHADGYGTRSSSLLEIDDACRLRYRFADGPPCETAYRMHVDGQI